MEKLDLKQLLSFSRLLKGSGNDEQSPDVAWKIFLSAFCIAFVSIAGFAYVAFNWAGSEPTSIVPQHTDRSTVTVDEVRAVVGYYGDKEATYKQLLLAPTVAPNIGGGFPSLVSATGTPTTTVESKTPGKISPVQ